MTKFEAYQWLRHELSWLAPRDRDDVLKRFNKQADEKSSLPPDAIARNIVENELEMHLS